MKSSTAAGLRYISKFIISILLTNLAYSQAPKRGNFKISNLGFTLSIDTSGVVVKKLNSDGLSMLFTKGIVFKFDIQEIKMSLQDLKREFKEEEFIIKLNERHYLEAHSDSATSKLKGMSCWSEKVSYRPVPEYWTDMKDQKKLSSKDLTTFANSNRESWKKSENYINSYVFLNTNKRLLQVSVLYFYDGKTPPGLEGKVKELLQGISILATK